MNTLLWIMSYFFVGALLGVVVTLTLNKRSESDKDEYLWLFFCAIFWPLLLPVAIAFMVFAVIANSRKPGNKREERS